MKSLCCACLGGGKQGPEGVDGDAGLCFLMAALLEERTDRGGVLMVGGEIGEKGDHYKDSGFVVFSFSSPSGSLS